MTPTPTCTPLRSMLFVPGDSEKKLAKAGTGPADALILDLEDAVAPERLPFARGLVRTFLDASRGRPGPQRWVRINPLSDPESLSDLAAVVGGAPDGIVLPKTTSAHDKDVSLSPQSGFREVSNSCRAAKAAASSMSEGAATADMRCRLAK